MRRLEGLSSDAGILLKIRRLANGQMKIFFIEEFRRTKQSSDLES